MALASSARAADDPGGEPPDPEALGAGPDPAPYELARRVDIGVYGNVDLRLFSESDEQVMAFGVATLDVFFASTVWDKLFAFADVQFEEDGNQIRFVLDRYLARYEPSQLLQIAAGQLHNPIIQWNCRASHGQYLLTPITRPKVLDREVDEGVWPTHLVGMSLEGELFDTGLGYLVALANGRGTSLTTIQVGEDANRHKAFIGNVNFRPFADGRLRLDATIYTDRIPRPPEEERRADDEALDELDVGASVQFEGSDVEFRSEVSRIGTRGRTSKTRAEVWGGYALVAYKFETEHGQLRPYLMGAHTGGDKAFRLLRYFLPAEVLRREIELVAGVRWEPVSGFALKMEFETTLIDDEAEHEAAVQAAFAY